MKRSNAVNLGLVAGFATAFAGCGDDTAYCVDRNDQVVQNQNCGDEHSGGGSGFFWLYGAHALSGGKNIRQGTRLAGATSKIASTNKSALTARGGFGKSGGSSSGIGRASASSGGS